MKIKVDKNTVIIRKICFAAACLALALVLPFVTGAIPEIGGALSPMHLPALISGVVCGPVIGGVVSFISPILRGAVFGSPVLFPRGITMAFELLAYAVSFGILYRIFPKKTGYIYASLGLAMIAGRLVGGVMKIVLLLSGSIKQYSLALFFSGYFVETIPGIVIQFIVIPPIIYALRRAKLIG